MPHITPGRNGWTPNAGRMIAAIAAKERDRHYAATQTTRAAERERVETEYYADNNCFPRPAGYLGTETDAHFYER